MKNKVDVSIPITWPTEQPIPQTANQVLVQRTPAEEVVLSFGHVSPVLTGSPAEQKEQALALSKRGVSVQVVARLVLTVKTAGQLQSILSEHLGGGG